MPIDAPYFELIDFAVESFVPKTQGVYGLYDLSNTFEGGTPLEVVYYGKSDDLQQQLFRHLDDIDQPEATRFNFEECTLPTSRLADLLREYKEIHGGNPPRGNRRNLS